MRGALVGTTWMGAVMGMSSRRLTIVFHGASVDDAMRIIDKNGAKNALASLVDEDGSAVACLVLPPPDDNSALRGVWGDIQGILEDGEDYSPRLGWE